MLNSHSKIELKVREHECDFQGFVNHAIYLNYLQQARYELLINEGINTFKLAQQGIYLIVIKIEVEYKSPLRIGDSFLIDSLVERNSKLRVIFHQKIINTLNEKLVLKAQVHTTGVNEKGKPSLPLEVEEFLAKITK